MAIEFDPVSYRIILDSASTTATEIYSRWVDWAAQSDNIKYGMVIRQVGSDDLGGGLSIPPYFFLQGDWRIRPMESDHNLTITGNLFVEGGGVPVVRTLGQYQVNVNYTVPVQAQGIVVGGGVGTIQEVKNAVWGANNLSSYGVGSAGEKLDSVGASANPWTADLSSYNTLNTAGKILKDTLLSSQQAVTNIADIVDDIRTELTPELEKIMMLESNPGMTDDQASMLSALFRIHGLDPTKPLVVTKTSRSAGSEIQQSIASDANTSVVTRL
jgi:hypothetical protein